MYLTDLALNDFRSYREVVIKLQPGVTTFIGENGQGKTNIVEAISYFATFSSHRVNADAALVRQGARAGVIRAKVVHGESPTILEVEIIAGKANRARINRGNAKPADLLGIVRTVIFAPEDGELIKGDPGQRRRFLDDVMIMVRPRLGGIKNEYEKVLRQRAALLKSLGTIKRRGGVVDDNTLLIWDRQLARLGSQIIAARAKIISALRPHVANFYQEVSGGKGIARIDYAANIDKRNEWILPTLPVIHSDDGEKIAIDISTHEEFLSDEKRIEELLLETLHRFHSQEIDRGMNLVGPHRDDLNLGLGTLPVKGYASHGETWSYALALKLAAWQFLREHESGNWSDDGEPILILDDVFAELDARRRQRLAAIVSQAQQVFITAAVGEDVPEELAGQKFAVHDGNVEAIDD